jgi:signal transduction histidine kinase
MNLPRKLVIYIWAVVCAGSLLAGLCFILFPLPLDPLSVTLALALIILGALADRHGLQLTPGTLVHVDTIPIFAAVMLFPPPLAIIISALARIFGRLDRKLPFLERGFNIGQTVLYVSISGLLREAIVPWPWVPDGPAAWLALLLAALSMYLLNTGIVAGIVSLQHHTHFIQTWTTFVPLDLLEQSVMFGFGLLTVLVVVPYPWALVLIALPAIAVFLTLDRSLHMEAQQKQLAEQNAHLADHLKGQTEQLREAYAILEDALAAKNQMLQNVSHELRTPMVSISGYTEALEEGLYGPLGEHQLGALHVISRNTRNMIRLVNDLLTLQSLDRGQLQLGDIDIQFVLSECCANFGSRAKESGLSLQMHVDSEVPHIRGDSLRLGQVLANLVDNAIKFSPNGGVIRLSATTSEREHVEIRVSDSGIGIPEDQLPNIYRRFYQVDGSSTRKYGGQGLGLAIAKRIIDLHGGTILAESQVGKGTSFIITLPITAPTNALLYAEPV